MKRNVRKAFGLLALGSLSLSACTDAAGYDLDVLFGYIPILSTMRGTVSYQPHTMPRLPAPGSVPAISPLGEVLPPFTQAQLDSVGAVLTNPLPATPEVLARGQVMYERQCSVCHGVAGDGAGSVIGPGRFPHATAVRDAATAARSDGYLYAVTRVGRGLMPAYGERISHEDRWAIVHYMRQLQGAQLPTPIEVQQPGVVPPAQTVPTVEGTAPDGPAQPVVTPQADTVPPAGQ
jgi:mono/diheme cytochrome c family protein